MDIERLSIMNPWWGDPAGYISSPTLRSLREAPVYYDNPLLADLNLDGQPFHIIRGPRQVGKTTFLKLLVRKSLIDRTFEASHILFMSCESLSSFREIIDTLEPWLISRKESRSLVILDEVSFVSEWQRAILHLGNLGLLVSSALIVTGSNARDLKESSEKFPGRRFGGQDISFYPLSPIDLATLPFLRGRSLDEIYSIYEIIGGFPHAIASYYRYGFVEREVYETYKNWIVGDAARYRLHEETLKHILYRIFLCCPNRITWPQLIENTPVKSHETALEYVEHLQDAFICQVLHCYDPVRGGPAIHKARKIFFVDPLLYYMAKGWKIGFFDFKDEVPQMLTNPIFHGGLFESCASSLLSRRHKIFFWYSTQEKKEVDIVHLQGNQIDLWDCKLADGPTYRAMGGKTVAIMNPHRFLQVLAGLEK